MCKWRLLSKSKVMMCTSMVDARRINVVLNGKLVKEVECFKYLGLHVAVDGGIYVEVRFRLNKIRKMCGGMKRVFTCKSVGMNAKRRFYEVLGLPIALYGEEEKLNM